MYVGVQLFVVVHHAYESFHWIGSQYRVPLFNAIAVQLNVIYVELTLPFVA